MNNTPNDGGPAFPRLTGFNSDLRGAAPNTYFTTTYAEGMTLRDWFAGQCQADDRLVKCIRAMDDQALELFALHPGLEREEHITEVEFTCYDALGSELAKVTRRLEIEAHAIARVRFMQADAMLKARSNQPT